jgi:hypothetical protein
MALRLAHFGKCIRNIWKVLKCGARKEWTDRVESEVVLRRVKDRNMLRAVERKAM